jgi:hypothetical protein
MTRVDILVLFLILQEKLLRLALMAYLYNHSYSRKQTGRTAVKVSPDKKLVTSKPGVLTHVCNTSYEEA